MTVAEGTCNCNTMQENGARKERGGGEGIPTQNNETVFKK